MKNSILITGVALIICVLAVYTALTVRPTAQSYAPFERTIATSTENYSLDLTYPIDPADTARIMESFAAGEVSRMSTEWASGSEAMTERASMHATYPDMPQEAYMYSLSYATSSSKVLHTRSYVLYSYTQTMGAHGSHALRTYTFGTSSTPVAIDQILDLSNNNNDLALVKLVASKLPGMLSEMYSKEMVDTGLGLSYLASDGVTLDKKKCECDGYFFGSALQKFIVTDTGITFLFEHYEVAPYAAGTVEVPITFEELAPYLTH